MNPKEVLRQAVVDALRRERWTVLQGHERPMGLENTFPFVHAMMTGGVVCWWRVEDSAERNGIIVWVEVEYHRVHVRRHIELGSGITDKIHEVPAKLRNELQKMLDSSMNLLDVATDVDRRIIETAKEMAEEWVPVLSPLFRHLLRTTLDEARAAEKDVRWERERNHNRPDQTFKTRGGGF